MIEKHKLKNIKDSENLAKKIASSLEAGDNVCFYGGLGTGKTFFCKEIIHFYCGKEVIVQSPTFNLLQIYSAPDFDIYHYDLYRIKSIDELYELGVEEAVDGKNVCLIEWPELVRKFLPKSINVSLVFEGDERFAHLSI